MLKEEYVQTNLECANKEELIKTMAEVFIKDGVVKDSYVGAVLAREKEFPTGLPAVAFDIAIPHAEARHSNRFGLTIGILKRPVEFQQMGAPDITLHAEMIFMIAVDNPKRQLDLLSSLVKLLQNKKMLLKIKNAASKKEIAMLVNENLSHVANE